MGEQSSTESIKNGLDELKTNETRLRLPVAVPAVLGGCVGAGAGAMLAIFKKAPLAPTASWIGLNMGVSCGMYTVMRRRLEENGETSHYANIASGGASGLLFGLVAGRSPHTMLAGSIVGTVLGASSEITEAKFESWRLRLLLESRHPELVGGTLGTATATDKVLSGERPWYWPEWAPFQPVGAPSVEGQLDQDIKRLKIELFEINEEINKLTAEHKQSCDGHTNSGTTHPINDI
eukprot:m.501392 g.501392  ORF g.501392 m.501392 type:complete len:235 (+) comp21838_c0_seq2:342-1046(+)